MNIYLVNKKIVLSRTEVPKCNTDGYIREVLIPWLDKTEEIYFFPKDREFIEKNYPRNESKHHVVDITKDVYVIPALADENGMESVFIGYLTKNKNMETKIEKYVVMVEGRTSPTKIHDSYETAEHEAKRLCLKEQLPVYICKAVTKVELNQVTITKL